MDRSRRMTPPQQRHSQTSQPANTIYLSIQRGVHLKCALISKLIEQRSQAQVGWGMPLGRYYVGGHDVAGIRVGYGSSKTTVYVPRDIQAIYQRTTPAYAQPFVRHLLSQVTVHRDRETDWLVTTWLVSLLRSLLHEMPSFCLPRQYLQADGSVNKPALQAVLGYDYTSPLIQSMYLKIVYLCGIEQLATLHYLKPSQLALSPLAVDTMTWLQADEPWDTQRSYQSLTTLLHHVVHQPFPVRMSSREAGPYAPI